MKFLQSDSNDEYVDSQKDAFKIETLYIVLLIAAVDVLQGMIRGTFPDHVILSGILLFIAVLYYTLRSTFSGIEHPNVATKKSYNKQRKVLRLSMFSMFVIYLTLNIGHKLLFNSNDSWFEIFAISILFIILFFALEMIGLKTSYKKNREIVDDSDEKD